MGQKERGLGHISYF